jgi:hypothetical protein
MQTAFVARMSKTTCGHYGPTSRWLVAGIHVSISNQKDVDGRGKPGHDEIQSEIGSALVPGYRFAHPGYISIPKVDRECPL